MFEIWYFIIYVLGILMLCVLHLLKAFRNMVRHIDVLNGPFDAKLLAGLLGAGPTLWGGGVFFAVWSDHTGGFLSGVLETASKFASVEFWGWFASFTLVVVGGYAVLRFVCNRVLPVAIWLLEHGFERLNAYFQDCCEKRALNRAFYR